MIRLSGFADEAADDIAGQIEVIKALGWKGIELRSVDGINAHDLSDQDFEAVRRALDKADIEVNCLGSTIANWGKKVDEDRVAAMAAVERAIARMKALGTKMIRIMSYAIDLDGQGRPLADQRLPERIVRLNEICGRFAAEGITPVHENCLNYGGMSWGHTLELLDAVPSLRLVFDTGNPSLTPDFSKPHPYPNQDAWESWQKLKSKVVHLHVKDGWRKPETGEEIYVYPGEGPSRVADVLADCLASGYSGWLTIEPHMAVVFHDASVQSPAERRKAVFIEYGRRVEAMLEDLGAKVADGVAATCWAPGGKA
ncbi:MAG: sugar phosphate isomerase/epimerase family protein [Spirochaetia bacterium]|nr:sugar phosphate isomerase/epimerase family protein [Spirochaetia bacterium]